ncbi:MAG: hypothetical protein ABFR47_09370 [Verrucomicrobiota bacterium]
MVSARAGQPGSKKKFKERGEACRVADDPVVVLKIRPVKAREGVEGKTGSTRGSFAGTADGQKRRLDAKG